MEKIFNQILLQLGKSYTLSNYLGYKVEGEKMYVFYFDKVIHILHSGYGSYFTWWAEGCIMQSDSKTLNTILMEINDSL